MHEINFSVPLSGSFLFDLNAISTAKMLCNKFPPLDYEVSVDNKVLTISGVLNDYWYERWSQAVFQLGKLDFDVE